MKNLKVIKDFTVTESGDAYISQRKCAELCGVHHSTIQQHIATRHLQTNDDGSLTAKSLGLVATHYAYKSKSCKKQAILLHDAILEAGSKAFIYYNAERVTPEQVKINNLQEKLIKAISNPRPKLIKSRHEELMSWVNKGWLEYTKSVVPKYTYRILNDKFLTKTKKGAIIRRTK